ncbi:OmpH family outer membrane protein [Qingshengfaniella alkalisoli]|uniref:OmpH family outer membrane protein n=1 Tax=Qingshengfaniella alkalisoli TaxID=2599296 RepID=A0A5B8IWU6_9RHOB|nr:OmpH family outer membrane protein [Qingshengfaniella alkalisoli]QDY69331.1 OmpH family outer membrane protein [Qingshengfaniella alkalisoli]
MTTNGRSTSRFRRASDLMIVGALALLVGGAPAIAQTGDAETWDSVVLTLDQDALFLQSAFGQRVQEELIERREALAAENRRIEAELVAEEQSLTERRQQLPPSDFAALATAFDEKVQRIRSERDEKSRDLQAYLETERQTFLDHAGPILARLLQERGGRVLIDRQAILMSLEGVDITQEAIAEIDSELGDGTDISAPNTPAEVESTSEQ